MYNYGEEVKYIESCIEDTGSSYGAPLVLEGKITIAERRWLTYIKLEETRGFNKGAISYYVASADSADTFGDGIWFGTLKEFVQGRNYND